MVASYHRPHAGTAHGAFTGSGAPPHSLGQGQYAHEAGGD